MRKGALAPMPITHHDPKLAEQIRRHLAVAVTDPMPDDPFEVIPELLRRAAARATSAALIPDLAEAWRQQRAAFLGDPEAALRAGHHLRLATAKMRKGFSRAEIHAARGLTLRLYDVATHAREPNARAWAHVETANVYVDLGQPKDAWHHAQMATFRPANGVEARQYDELLSALRERIRIACNDGGAWLARQTMADSYA